MTTKTEEFITSQKIQLYPSGKYVDPWALEQDDISIADIARSLSMQVRFTGHLSHFWSVGQHSLVVSAVLPDELKLWGLMHDASEAYVGDMTRPLKRRKSMAAYRGGESLAQKAIAKKYDLCWPIPYVVHVADDMVCALEGREFKNVSGVVLSVCGPTVALAEDRLAQIRVLPWYSIERIFLGEFSELMRDRSTLSDKNLPKA